MRGHIVKVTTGGRSLEEYLKGCNQAGQGLEAYLGEHSDGLRFHRYADGTKCSSKRLRDGGLEMLLDGRDPDSGELLKSFRAGNVRAYEIPLNDSKDLDVASVVYGDVREARMKAQARGEEAVRRFLAERLTVRLRCGDGRRRWVRPDEVMFVSATHFTSRAGDPELHRHLELINRVRVGDEWYSIDSSRLFGMYENIRSVYETTVYGDAGLCDAMAAHGMTLDMQGRVPELGNASDVFSKRRDAINCISSSRCFVFSHVFFSGLGSCMHFPYFSGCAEVFLPNMRASLTRRLWPVNSRSRPWCTMRSMIAAASLSSAKTVPHLLNSMFVVNMMLRLS